MIRFLPNIFALAVLTAITSPAHGATRDLLKKPDTWFAGDEAKTAAANILSYQSDYGGWPKNFDLTAAPFTGKPADLVGELKPIFDNGATTDEIRFMAKMYAATKDPRYLRSLENGVDFILIAQYPSGGWPQSYPPDVTYHRYVTFNDDSMQRLMVLLQEIAKPGVFDCVDAGRRSAAASAFQRGIECILKCQIRVDGRLTAWCAQHDEIDLSPRPARRFELASISGAESVKLVKLLMSIDQPAPEIVQAIEGAIEWFKSAKITGWRMQENPEPTAPDHNYTVTKDPAAGPIWARFYDIASNRPLFSALDSRPHLGFEQAGWARHGYQWSGAWPLPLLEKDYPAWKAKLAQSGTGPAPKPWQPKARIALAGDSTVKDESGWGFGFKKRLGPDVVCANFSQGGQSSKSFRDTHCWEKTLAAKPDYVLIQFGHNDGPGKGPNRETDPATTYPENLTRFVAEARAIGAKPILVTSLTRRAFQPDGTVRRELAPYVEAMKKVAAEQHVPLVDLNARSVAYVEKLGPQGVAPIEPMILPKAPVTEGDKADAAKPASTTKPTDIDVPPPSAQPRHDGTHLNIRGSIEFGAIVAEELARVVPETRQLFR